MCLPSDLFIHLRQATGWADAQAYLNFLTALIILHRFPICEGSSHPFHALNPISRHVTFTLQKERGKWRVIKTEGIAPEEIFL